MAEPDEQFARSITACGRELLQSAREVLGDFHWAEDAVAQTFLKAWHRRASLRDPRKLKPWLARICRNEALTILRQIRPRRTSELRKEGLSDRSASATANLDEAAYRTGLLGRLPEGLRVCASMFFVEGRSYCEIASIVGLPLSTVRGRIYQSRRRLRKEIEMTSEPSAAGEPVSDRPLRPRDEAIEWRGCRARFLGICWTGCTTLYDRAGKRLSRTPAVVKKSSLLEVPQDDAWQRYFNRPALSIFWELSPLPPFLMGSDVTGLPSGCHCTPSRGQGEDFGRSGVLCFRSGAPAGTDTHVRIRSGIWGEADRESDRVFRFEFDIAGNSVATSKPGWGALYIFQARRGKRKGTGELSVAFSSSVAEMGCMIFGLDTTGQEVPTHSRNSGSSSCPDGHVGGITVQVDLPPKDLTGLVLYPRHSASVDWGKVRIPPVPK